MPKMTLTEALAQHKLTLAKMEDKTRQLSHYTVRDSRIVDPLAKSGTTSTAYVAQEMQAIRDLAKHALKLHSAITETNRKVEVKFGNMSMSVEEALQWRREVAPRMKALLNGILAQARQARDRIQADKDKSAEVAVNFDEAQTIKDLEALTDALGKLDTELSIVNATVTVEV